MSRHSPRWTWKRVGWGCLAAPLGLSLLGGCPQGTEPGYGFSIVPAVVEVIRGDPSPTVVTLSNIFASNGPDTRGTYDWSFRWLEELPGIMLPAFPPYSAGPSAPDPVGDLFVEASVPTGVYVATLEGDYYGLKLAETLAIQVLPDLTIEITAPASGTTVSASEATVEAIARDAFGVVTSVTVSNNGASPSPVFTGSQPMVSVSHPVTLSPGANTVVLVARNSTGNTASAQVTVTLTPVASGTARWDGEAGDGLWFTARNWDTDQVPGVGDDVRIDDASAVVTYATAGTSEVRSLVNAGALVLAMGSLELVEASSVSGTLEVARDPAALARPSLLVGGTLSVDGSLSCVQGNLLRGRIDLASGSTSSFEACLWSDVTIENEGAMLMGNAGQTDGRASLLNQVGGTLELSGTTVMCTEDPCLSRIENAGTMSLTGFQVRIDPELDNSGTLDAGSTGAFLRSGSNSGTIASSAAFYVYSDWATSASSSWAGSSLLASDGVRIAALGTLDFVGITLEGSTLDLGAPIALASDAVLTLRPGFDGPVLVPGALVLRTGVDVEVKDLFMESGSLHAEQGAELRVWRTFGLSSGTLSGPGTTRSARRNILEADAVFSLEGTGPKIIDGHNLIAGGVTSWVGGDISAGNGARITIAPTLAGGGVLYAYDDDTFDGGALGGAPARLIIDGQIRKVGGVGTSTIRACFDPTPPIAIFQDAGTIQIVELCM